MRVTGEISEEMRGFFNIYGFIIIAVIMIPNIVFAIKIKMVLRICRTTKLRKHLSKSADLVVLS